MSSPLNIETIVPAKWKPYIGLVGSVASFAVPYLIKAEEWLPSPWPVVIAAVIAGLTFLGIYKAPYVPPGAVLAPNTPAVAVAAQAAVTQEAVSQASATNPLANVPYKDPWP